MKTKTKISSKKIVAASSQPPTPPSCCHHILLADDDSYTRASNARVLTWSGYKVHTVANGADAWEALDQQNYDLLITEHEMPEVTGVQLLKRLRSRGIPMPVIMASGTVPTKELKLHPGLRLEAALLKPVPGDQLLQTVKHVLQTAESIVYACQPVLIKDKQIPQTKALTRAPQPTRAILPKRILFVDDEPLLRQLHQEVLSDFGYVVELAEDGGVAWDALQRRNYDLLITDNDMPKVTGVELLEKLNAARITLPVIMVSATMPTEKLKQRQLLPVEATLNKPYSISDLVETVKIIFSTSKNLPRTTYPAETLANSVTNPYAHLHAI